MKNINISIPTHIAMIEASIEYLTGLLGQMEQKPTVIIDIQQVETPPTDAPPPPIELQTPPTDAPPPPIELQTPPTDAPPPPSGVELDEDGLPWDGRIHGSKRAKLAKTMQWKRKRGVDAALVAIVESELRAAMAIPVDAAPPPPPVDAAPPPPPVDAAPPPPPVDAAPPPETVRRTPDGKEYAESELLANGWTAEQFENLPIVQGSIVEQLTFPTLMAKITRAMADSTVTQVAIDTALSTVGLTSLPLLSARPDLIPAIVGQLFSE